MNSSSITKILNVYKPVGMSSYDVVRKVKNILGFKKVGHGGTLDPFAEGVLIILIGRKATRRMRELLAHSKSYKAVLQVGNSTDTGDLTGKIIDSSEIFEQGREELDLVEQKFSGDIVQTPPQYSAKKINGERAYKKARKGEKVELDPINVSIEKLKLSKLDKDKYEINVTCSSGTYIRVLGEDIAGELGMAGHLISLKRTRAGNYHIQNSVLFENLEQSLQTEIELLQNEKEKSHILHSM